MNPEDRYQFQPWYVKLWRRRILVAAWFRSVWTFLTRYRSIKRSWADILDRTDKSLWKIHWSVSKGMAHNNMGWWYTGDEVRDMFERDLKRGEEE